MTVGWGDVEWADLAQDRDRWRALVNSVLNLRVPWNAGKLSSVLTTRDLSSSAQLHRVSQLNKYIFRGQWPGVYSHPPPFCTDLAAEMNTRAKGEGAFPSTQHYSRSIILYFSILLHCIVQKLFRLSCRLRAHVHMWTSTTKRKTIYNKAARRRKLNLKSYWILLS
jgi:hypothetical protein